MKIVRWKTERSSSFVTILHGTVSLVTVSPQSPTSFSLAGALSTLKNEARATEFRRRTGLAKGVVRSPDEVRADMADAFDKGDRARFLSMWEKHLAEEARQSPAGLKLEFKLHLRFACRPGLVPHFMVLLKFCSFEEGGGRLCSHGKS